MLLQHELQLKGMVIMHALPGLPIARPAGQVTKNGTLFTIPLPIRREDAVWLPQQFSKVHFRTTATASRIARSAQPFASSVACFPASSISWTWKKSEITPSAPLGWQKCAAKFRGLS